MRGKCYIRAVFVEGSDYREKSLGFGSFLIDFLESVPVLIRWKMGGWGIMERGRTN